MPADPIDTLSASNELQLTDALNTALRVYLDTIDASTLASAIDDLGANHIRAQLALLLDLDSIGAPEPLAEALTGPAALLASFVAAVVALAASQVRHTVSASDTQLVEARNASRTVITRYLADTATALRSAIESAIYGPGTPYSRAKQLKRSIGLSTRQTDSLEIMRTSLQRFVDAPMRLTPSRVGSSGVRIPPTYTRRADTRSIMAATRGRISAAQRQILTKSLSNPKLTQDQADALLDKHATAMRRYRARTTASEAIHGLAELGKLTGWRIAQRFGALPAEQRRHWHTAGDERVRHTHAQVPTMNPRGVPLNEPFKTPLGPAMTPPLEIGCRCKAMLRPAP